MIPKDCNRLAEVDFPIAEVSRHAVREKSIRHGHPSTLHLWWARRPLASSRAVLLAILLPDPCDKRCPEIFKVRTRQLLPAVGCGKGETDEKLQQGLLKFVSDFANWDNAAKPIYLNTGRALVRAAHGYETPLVVDPFAGGGSIPLEALRLGCDTFASDLNPVACLILKVMLEDIPRHGIELAEELRRVGSDIKRQAERELADLYPRDPDGAVPIAYLWARTVRCEAPSCGAEIPLIRSFWLCRKPKRKWAMQCRIERHNGEPPRIRFEVFEPKSDSEVRGGTVTRARATCLCCGVTLPPDRVREQLAAQRGGTDVIFDEFGKRKGGALMTVVVTLKPGEAGRHYRLSNYKDYEAVQKAQQRVAEILDEWERSGKQGLCPVPDEPTPIGGGSGAGRAFSVHRYGMKQWCDLFTARQKAVLVELVHQIRVVDISEVLRKLLICVLSIFVRACNGNARLRPDSSVAPAFGMHALPITWSFPETILSGGRSEHFDGALFNVARILERFSIQSIGQVQLTDATEHPLPDQSVDIWFTDPPYYDAIPYSDLSDFFLVWIKRILTNNELLRDPFDPENPLSPKAAEAVQDEIKYVDGRPKDREWFEEKMAAAFTEGCRVLSEDGVGSVVFAHKTTEGWEALLSGMIRGGWTITGSWPVATESETRLRARDSSSLATSVHLICRPRPNDAPVGDWADILRELPVRVSDWIERLQGEGVHGADLVFACIGPALEIFSRYHAVETAEGNIVGLPDYLPKVWEVVGRTALQQVLGTSGTQARNGLSRALEEDARLTALFLWTMQSTTSTTKSDKQDDGPDEEALTKVATAGFTLPFDVVRRFAQPMGIDLDSWTDRIIGQEKGVVRLLPVTERASDIFGEDSMARSTISMEGNPYASAQQTLFPDWQDSAPAYIREPRPPYGTTSDEPATTPIGETTLDRVHAAMLLQSGGYAGALRELITAEQERGPDFLRLANALSALYPQGSNEKRLLDAMLLAAPG